jgi:GT2 family glycosyltransferase
MQREPPSINIIILNWNGIEDTIECLDSIGKLTYPNVQAIVVDNGSKDDQAKEIAEAFPNIVVLPQKENLGFCGGCNVGIRYALDHEADYVMLLNNDTLVPPDLFEKLLAGVQGLKNLGAASPIVMHYPETDKVSITDVRWNPSKAIFVLRGENDAYENFAERGAYATEFACGCCLFTSTEMFRIAGLLDERYFAFFDEAEWCERIRRLGYSSYIVPSAVMYHKGSRSTPSLVGVYLMTRNRLLWMKENVPLGKRLRSFPLLVKEVLWHAANLLGLTKKYYSKNHSRAALQGYKDYFRGKFYKWSDAAERIILEK